MAREAFIKKNIGPTRLALIGIANEIVSDYQAQGYRLTLRQLFYQMVSRTIIPNTERAYKNLGDTISDGRLVGMLDWNAIEDRIRVPRVPQQFDSLSDLVDAALQAYRLLRWEGQKHYVELWVEKDALAGVLAPLASQYHVTLMVNRGYSSQSAMYESADRFKQATDQEKDCVLLYLGDHDPSGEDMVRDIQDRMDIFGAEVEVRKVALTMAQVKHYNPPPNPAKLSDSRADGYIALHGASSWEVDALPPDVLQGTIRGQIERLLDSQKMGRIIAKEKRDKKALREAVKALT